MKEIVVANGEYTKSDGSTGVNWVKVGIIGVSQNGKEYAILEPHINLAGLSRSEKGGVMCSIIDKSNNNNHQQNNQQQQGYNNQQQGYQQQNNQQGYNNQQQQGYNP